MNIGFEAKRAYTNGTGLGHYSRTLITSLATYFQQHEYFLFTPKKTTLFSAADYANVHAVTPTHFPSTMFPAFWRSSWVKKDLKNLGIDIYHGLSHEIPMGIQHTKIPAVVTMHDLIFERNPEQYNPIDVKIYRKKFKYACQYAQQVIAISQQTKDDLIQFYQVPEKRISICYQSCNTSFTQAVDLAERQRVKELYQLPDTFYLYVGSIIERKNLLTICKALHVLGKTNTIPLVVIGNGGEYMHKVKKYIEEKSLQDKVIFLSDKFSGVENFRTAADFPAIYQQALCMIYPSFFEGFGIPVLEALWSKIPVITSNVSCMPETGGDAAFYVNPSNENEMAKAMQAVANDISLRNEMINKGVIHANNFTQEKCAAAVMKVYEQL